MKVSGCVAKNPQKTLKSFIYSPYLLLTYTNRGILIEYRYKYIYKTFGVFLWVFGHGLFDRRKVALECWKKIREFPNYSVSDSGYIRNDKTGELVQTSVNNHGHVKVALSHQGSRKTRSVALLTASEHLPSTDYLSDSVILLNGDLEDLRVDNMAWRPQWFVWKYRRQMKEPLYRHYTNLPVRNTVTGCVYPNIVKAGKSLGLLYADIWVSTYTGNPVYPHGFIFEVVK